MNKRSDTRRNRTCITCKIPVDVVEHVGRSLSQIRWLTCDPYDKSCHLKCLVSDHCLPTTSDEDKQKTEHEFSKESYVYICKMCRQESARGLVSQSVLE